jgi:hypothetical protein
MVIGNGTDPVFAGVTFANSSDAASYSNPKINDICNNTHNSSIERLQISGNNDTCIGLQVCNGGFGTVLRDLVFVHCTWGIKTVGFGTAGGNTADLQGHNLTFSSCVNGAINYNLYGGSGRFSLFGCQGDNYGEYFMLVNHYKGAINQFDIHGARLEASDALTGKNVIKYYTESAEPRPALFYVNSLTTRHSAISPTIDNGIFYEDSDTTARPGATWNLNNVARLDNGTAQTGGKMFYSNIPASPVVGTNISTNSDYVSSLIVQEETIMQEYGWDPV